MTSTYQANGHSQWAEMGVHHIGMTTAWPPNKVTPGANNVPDADLCGVRERVGGPTFAAMTSRSYHSGGVQCVFADGSVHFISEEIDGFVWRALGTVAGGETVPDTAY